MKGRGGREKKIGAQRGLEKIRLLGNMTQKTPNPFGFDCEQKEPFAIDGTAQNAEPVEFIFHGLFSHNCTFLRNDDKVPLTICEGEQPIQSN